MSQTHELPPPYTVGRKFNANGWYILRAERAFKRAEDKVWGDLYCKAANEAQQAERNYWQPIHEADRKRIAELEAALHKTLHVVDDAVVLLQQINNGDRYNDDDVIGVLGALIGLTKRSSNAPEVAAQ